MQHPDYTCLESSAETIMTRWSDFSPSLTLMLGSGWGPIVDLFNIEDSVPYSEIPALGATGVEGHAGNLSRVSFAGKQALLFQGRRHYYELPKPEAIVFPMFLARKLGVKTALLTNAAGGIREDLTPGSIMVLDDHINLMGFNPLAGPAHPLWGDRFPDMTETYSGKLRKDFLNAGEQNSITIKSGVYCAFFGPSYETPAEVRMARSIGADAVGMSTTPSAILAKAAGMEILGISCITNFAAGLSTTPLSHQEVMEIGKDAIKTIESTFKLFLDTNLNQQFV